MIKKTLLCGMLTCSLIAPLTVSADTTSMANVEVSDKQMISEIQALYAKSALLKTANISVMVNKQDVSLSGALDTDMQYGEAVTLAQSVKGVADVNADALTVQKSNAPLTDTYYTAKVKGVLMKENLFGDKAIEYWPISVETKNGVVYLTGIVDTEAQRNNIVNIVKMIGGIKSVNSTITVK